MGEQVSQPQRLAPGQEQAAIAVLGRAFNDDALTRFLAPDDRTVLRFMPAFGALVIKYCQRHGEVWTAPDVTGVAAWLPPGKTSPSIAGMLQAGLPKVILRLGWGGMQRLNEVIEYAEKVHKQVVPGPHWYLWGLGVDPAHQRQGIGGQLIQPVLGRADATGLPCYLETQVETNLAFYRKHGFDVVSAGATKGGLPMWCMLRPPQANGLSASSS
jgi:ribosomal protein S18 acetylase RimI-like enzyme